jgi:hypothetical protein
MAGAHAVIGDEEQVGESLGRHLRDWLASVDRSEPAQGNGADTNVFPDRGAFAPGPSDV